MGEFYLGVLAIACLAGAGWIFAVRRRDLTWTGLVSAPFVLVCVVGLLLPSALSFLEQLDRLVDTLEGNMGGAVLMSVVGVFAMIALGWGWFRLSVVWRVSDRLFLLVSLGVLILVRLVWAIAFEVDATSDFASMWQVAGDLTERFETPERRTGPLLLERSWPYFYPLQLLFGHDLLVVRIANVFVTLLASVGVFFLTRSWFGSSPARLAFLVSSLGVEVWLASGIPNHDVPGALLTIACFVGLVLLWRLSRDAPLRALGLGIAVGLALELLDLQRTTGGFLIVSWGAVCFARLLIERWWRPEPGESSQRIVWRRPLTRLALVLLVPFVTFFVAEVFLQKVELARPSLTEDPTPRSKVFAAQSTSWSTGRWVQYAQDWATRRMEARDWEQFNRRMIVTDFVHSPREKLGQIVRKSERLYHLGAQGGFYLHNPRWRSGVELDHRSQQIQWASNTATVVFLLCLILGVARAWNRSGEMTIALAPAFYLAAMSLALILISETQPRYMFQIWYLGAIYVGLLAEKRDPTPSTEMDGDVA